MSKNSTNHLKNEIRYENILALKRAIDDNSFHELPLPDEEWGGAYVIITSSPDRVFNLETDEDNWIGNRSQDTYVLTQHSLILSKFFYYVKDNIMIDRDFYLYGFMALMANDFIREFGDGIDYRYLLDYLVSGISFYYNALESSDYRFMFRVMRFFLSENVTDEEIRRIGVN